MGLGPTRFKWEYREVPLPHPERIVHPDVVLREWTTEEIERWNQSVAQIEANPYYQMALSAALCHPSQNQTFSNEILFWRIREFLRRVQEDRRQRIRGVVAEWIGNSGVAREDGAQPRIAG